LPDQLFAFKALLSERKCGGELFWQKKDAPLAINWRSSIINTQLGETIWQKNSQSSSGGVALSGVAYRFYYVL
jgi:hypothetical protein